MQKVTFLFIHLIAISAYCQNNKPTSTSSDSLTHLKIGTYNGYYKTFYKNGRTKMFCLLKNGTIDSFCTTYNKKGKTSCHIKRTKDTFWVKEFNKKGLLVNYYATLHDTILFYDMYYGDEFSSILQSFPYHAGKLNGLSRIYFPIKDKKQIGPVLEGGIVYKKGLRDGQFFYYYETVQLKTIGCFRNDSLCWANFYDVKGNRTSYMINVGNSKEKRGKRSPVCNCDMFIKFEE